MRFVALKQMRLTLEITNCNFTVLCFRLQRSRINVLAAKISLAKSFFVWNILTFILISFCNLNRYVCIHHSYLSIYVFYNDRFVFKHIKDKAIIFCVTQTFEPQNPEITFLCSNSKNEIVVNHYVCDASLDF